MLRVQNVRTAFSDTYSPSFVFGHLRKNDTDYNRTFSSVVFLLKNITPHQSENTVNFRIEIVGFRRRKMDSGCPRKKGEEKVTVEELNKGQADCR